MDGGLSVPQAVDDWLRVTGAEGRDGRPPVSDATHAYYSYVATIMKAYAWEKGIRDLTKPDIVAFRSWLINERGPKLAAKTKAWKRYRPMLYLAVDSGMRPQEYVVVAGSNITEAGVQVERALDRSGSLSVTKTPAARHFIELSPETLDMVTHYRDKVAVENDHNLMFPTSEGTWQSPDNWRKRGFGEALERAGLVEEREVHGKTIRSPKYSPYALRHYFASMLIAENTDIAKIKTLMGHTDISTTFDVYAHLIRQAEDKRSKRPGMLARMKEGVA